MKKRTLTNRELSENLMLPIGMMRRNTKEFLGADPIATKRSGYKREFSINDGFFVFFGTNLVSHCGLSFDNARKAIDTIKPWLLKIGYVPDPPKGAKPKGIESEIIDFKITFYIYKGELIEIFMIEGERGLEEPPIKEDEFGVRYAEDYFKQACYWVKNDHGKVKYFLSWEADTDFLPEGIDIEEDHKYGNLDSFLDYCTKIRLINLTNMLTYFIENVISEEDVQPELFERLYY